MDSLQCPERLTDKDTATARRLCVGLISAELILFDDKLRVFSPDLASGG